MNIKEEFRKLIAYILWRTILIINSGNYIYDIYFNNHISRYGCIMLVLNIYLLVDSLKNKNNYE